MILIDREDAIATITLDNPTKRNRLSNQAMADLGARFRELNSDPEIRVVVITGSGE